MRTFSVAQAFSAGVDLIERRPWTIAWWALAVIVLQLAPRLLLSAYTGGNELGAMGDLTQALGDPARTRAALQHLREAQAGLGLWAVPLSFWSLFCTAIFHNAAYRSVLEPGKSSFGYLRVGVAEFWQFLTLFVVGLMFLVYAAACLMVIFVMEMVARGVGGPATGWIVGLTLLVLVVFSGWLGLRLSLGTVLTFAKRRFAYFESFKLTKGLVWRMFWTVSLISALLIGLSVALSFLPLVGVLDGARGAAPPPPMLHPPAAAEILSLASLGIVVWAVAGGLVSALTHAFTLTPWAVIYRDITKEEAAH